jgi:D-alanyl-D-alanine carboxypeptidase (penicillin-binding protein 5/6)
MFKKLIPILLIIFITTPNVCALNAGSVSAECAVVISAQTGKVIYEKNAYEKHSMASTTKIMTSLLAVESGMLPNEIIVSKDMLNVEGTSMGLQAGDSVSLEELVYGMLLQSGNDAANVTAIYLSGSADKFAELMNARAKQIGMTNTHFVTPSGLDNEEHYSTAYDMALLGREAVKNRKFLSICSRKNAVLTYGNPPYKRTLSNHNRMLSYYDDALGIKTGFTKKSGRCLVSYAVKDGVGLVAVTLNDPNDWYDHKLMLDYGFESVKPEKIAISIPYEINVVGGEKASVCVKSTSFFADSTDSKTVIQRTYIDKFVYAPVKTGTVVGHTDIYSDSKLVGTVAITAAESVDSNAAAIPQVKKEQSFLKRMIEKIKERF